MRKQNGRFFFADNSSGRFHKAGYDPAEPRDERSRWTSEGGSDANLSKAAYQGHFHDLIVDDFLEGLKSQGSTVLKNIRGSWHQWSNRDSGWRFEACRQQQTVLH